MSDDARALPDGPAGTGRPVVEAVDISKAFGATQALLGVGITVRAGSTHALVGRNGAGKSTLVSILTGLEAPDRGRVLFAGDPAPSLGDRDAWRRQVACVYQKSTIIPTLTVAENLFLNRLPRNRARLIAWSAVRQRARDLLATWSVDVAVEAPASQLNVEQRQLVEVARALAFGARFIILDEPTAQLDGAAIQRLFGRIGALQSQGVTFLFISHHLQEVYDICDTVSVLRDARHVVTAPVEALSKQDLVAAMTGERLDPSATLQRSAIAADAPAALRVSNLRLAADSAPVEFTIRAGEVLGLAGGGGSGKVEVAESIVGLRRPAEGHVEVARGTLAPGSVGAAIAAGIGFVPQDRHREGFVPLLSIAENVTMTAPTLVGSAGVIQPQRRDTLASTLIDSLAIKASGPEVPVASLSGGNQQKVVMARALATDPAVLVLVTPTAGVDVRSKETLLAVVERVRARGTAVLMVSDELDDLRICDRVVVMFHGRTVAEVPRGWRDNDLVAAMEGIGTPHVVDDV
jgi:simple sugar transport system ATP-binding protein